ncbi:MAG TPA: hypothetical protein VGQ86_09570 [Candidatus Limnocylindria bacterium]|jgi:hypothetical protein|nr:hypothetical protein [Candidatus Limnocylindria bacterium]
MATIGTSYVEGPAMRMHAEQIEKRLRRERQHDEAIAREERTRRSMENSRRIVEAARATGAVIEEIWPAVDQPTVGD